MYTAGTRRNAGILGCIWRRIAPRTEKTGSEKAEFFLSEIMTK